MKEQQCQITILPEGQVLTAPAGDLLYTLLLVAGIISANDPRGDRLRLERGSIGPAGSEQAEAAVFTRAELAEGWLLASQRRLNGDAVLTLCQAAEAEEAPPVPLASGYGLAINIGAVTITAGLADLSGVRVPLLSAQANSQLQLGIELADRLSAARRDPATARQLTALLRQDLDQLTFKLAARAGIAANSLGAVTLAGSHPLLSLVRGHLPAAGDEFGRCQVATGADLGSVSLAPTTPVYFLPSVSAQVGADAVAAALASGLLNRIDSPQITLLVGLGMSGVVIAAGHGRLLACTVPSLPFEGAGISCGMPAVTGAITDLRVDSRVTLRTVRDGRPRGLSGAGLIAAVARLRQLDAIDSEGRLTAAEGLPPEVARRFRGTAAGREFVLSAGDANFPADVCLNQEDVLQMQMAKGAIFAACRAVLAALAAREDEISELFLAESYRANLNPADVLALGMLPRVAPARVRSIGDASWQGAYLALSSSNLLEQSERIAAAMETLDLNTDPIYAEQFIKGMNF